MPSRRYKWGVVALLWFAGMFNYADRQAIFSVFPLLKVEMGLSDVQLGVVGAAFMWIYAAAGPLAGIVGDRFRRKTLIITGLVFWSLITIATALSKSYWHLVIFRALEGFGEAFYFPASISLISDYHGRDTRSRALSIHQSSIYVGTIAGGTVAGILGQHYGWRSSFYLFGGLGVLLGFVLLSLLREPERGQSDISAHAMGHSLKGERSGQPGVLAGIAEMFKIPMVRVLVAVFLGANFVAMIFLTWLPSFLYRKFGMSLSMAGFSGTAYLQVASILGVICSGFLGDRLAMTYRGGRMMAQVLGLLGGVPFIFLTGWTLSVPVLILAMAGFGFFKGMQDANQWASLYDVVRPEHRATIVGVTNAIGWMGGGIAPVAIAAASQRFGMSACISANAAIYLFFGLLLIFGIKRFMPGRVSAMSKPLSSVVSE